LNGQPNNTVSGYIEMSSLMKRKPMAETETPVVAKEILDLARLAADDTDKAKRIARCEVCGDPCAPISNEALCWVCRRLKISAWKDSDMQMGAQE
jgi:ribosomal protein S14